ncbi:MAG TPA: hypothetical protein VNF71_06965 [Acidimicrobiales bacterium]|nr:hypothetical protein [Acidimicrobiales bacterium]
MPFGKKAVPAPAPPKTTAQLIDEYRAQAIDQLQRAGKGGRLDAETRHATMATAAADLANGYLLQLIWKELIAMNQKLGSAPAVAEALPQMRDGQ